MAPDTILQTLNRPSAVLDAIESIAGPDTTRFRAAVAYTSLRGCRELTNRISAAIGESTWTRTPKLLITCFEFRYTEPQALELFINLDRSQVSIASATTGSFHPKLYIFDRADRRDFLVGSPNLTGRALADNTEMAVIVRDAPPDEIDPLWNELESLSEVLTRDRLQDYADTWEEQSRTRELDPPIESLLQPETYLPFPSATEDLDLQDWHNLWIQAGSMSSGYSNNQLELPRGASAFFDHDFNRYGDEQLHIGNILLMARGRTWERSLAWHGDNRMERVYLPTVGQGGFDYRGGTAIRFQRKDEGFRLVVGDWNGDAAASWRARSVAEETVFLVGSVGTNRVCGLF